MINRQNKVIDAGIGLSLKAVIPVNFGHDSNLCTVYVITANHIYIVIFLVSTQL